MTGWQVGDRVVRRGSSAYAVAWVSEVVTGGDGAVRVYATTDRGVLTAFDPASPNGWHRG